MSPVFDRLKFTWIVFLLVSVGCDSTIETPPSLSGTYTLWGALDPTQEVQTVRVVAVTDTLVPTRPGPLPVTLASVNLATGEETPWRDSLVAFANGSVGHVYSARFRPAYGGRYSVVLRRDAGATETTATMRVPERTEPILSQVNTTNSARTTALWPGAEQLNRVRVTFVGQIGRVGSGVQTTVSACDTFSVTIGAPSRIAASTSVDGGWSVSLSLANAYSLLLDAAPVGNPNGDLRIGIRRITIRGQVATTEWSPPGGVFDFEALAVPEVFGNVKGGFGFVGAAYRSEIVVRPAFRELFGTNFVDTEAQCEDYF